MKMAKKLQKEKLQFSEIRPSSWNSDQLCPLLGRIRGKRILVIGDVGLDRYTIGSVERISPEAPVPVVLVQEEKLKLGLAANVADNIQSLGGIPLLLGVVGQDRGADDFRELLLHSQIKTSYLVTDSSRRTALKDRVVSDRQQLVRIDYESLHPIEEKIEKQVLKKFRDLLPDVDGVVVEDYAKGLLTYHLLKTIFKESKQAGKFVGVDPNLKTPAEYYRGATLLTPNTKEAEALSGIFIRDPKSLIQAGTAILQSSRASHVVVTRGKEGMAIFAQGSSRVRLIPTYAREVYDVSGAGDTVISVLVLTLLSGAHIEEAAVLSNLAAGVEVGKRGTATVSTQEIEAAMTFFRP